MGLLRSAHSGRVFCPGSQVLVGRGPSDLLLDSPLVSAPHALLHWSGQGWQMRDIGSRNGSWLGETRLELGKDLPLGRGAQLCFGDQRERWVLVDDGPPGPVAVRDDGEIAASKSGLLPLPSPDQPSALLLQDDESWVVERDEETLDVHDGLVLELEGRRWTLHLPHTPVEPPVASTLDATTDDLGQVVLCFTVSQDEEHVDLKVLSPGGRVPLSPRNHHFVLLALARALDGDLRDGAPEAERGWLYQDDLCRMVGVDQTLLNLHLFRAREQVAAAGLSFAGRLIERRRLSRQLRLSPVGVEIRQA